MSGGFLNQAQNRLAASVALPIWRLPPWQSLALFGSLIGLTGASFLRQGKPQLLVIVLLASTLLFADFLAAGQLASHLSQNGPKAMRISLSFGFWAALVTACLILLNAAQRAKLSSLYRAIFGLLIASVAVLMVRLGVFDTLSLAREFASHGHEFGNELLRHIFLVGAAIILSLGFSIPLTWLVLKYAAARGAVFASLGILQTIPSIALFGLMIMPLSALGAAFPSLRNFGISGTGPAPAILALTLYSILPLVRSLMTGLLEVAQEVKEAAIGIGYGGKNLFFNVTLPLAMPAVLSGLRVVLIQAIGLGAVAALIGAGGLGTFIFQGIGQYALDLVLIGAIPIILLAVSADFCFEIFIGLARKNL
jgi:osmoprotectant transport system permease protein